MNILSNAELTKLSPTSLLSLFIMDASSLGITNSLDSEGVFRFHAGFNGLYSNLIFSGDTYYAFPIESDGFEYDGSGGLPRPKLRCANVNAYVSNLVMKGQNLIGAKIIRRRVFARFLDNENFSNNLNPFGSPNSEATFTDDIFYINRKITENQLFVEFELASQLEIDNVKLPRRKITAHTCPWKYRGEGCRYNQAPVTDSAKRKFTEHYGLTLVDQGAWNSATSYSPGDYVYIESTLELNLGEKFFYVCKEAAQGIEDLPKTSSKWIADVCDKTLQRCKLTFGKNNPLPFGNFPSTSRLSF